MIGALALPACSGAAPGAAPVEPALSAADPAEDDPSESEADPDAGSSKDGGNKPGDGGKPPPPPHPPPPPPGDLSLDTGADLAALADPLRPSAAYECQGTPITSADVPDYVAQGTSGPRGDSRKHAHWNEYGLGLTRAERTCTVATGCGTWHGADLIVDFPEYHRELVRVALKVAPSADAYIENPLWDGHGNYGSLLELRELAPTLDLQLSMRLMNASLDANADVRTRMRIRATRTAATGPICVSAASAVTKTTSIEGVTTETFWVGSVSIPKAARTVNPPLDESPFTCPGALSTDADIAALFAPGQSQLMFKGASATNHFARSCHPITGCTAYTTSYRSTRLVQLEVLGAGFQVRLDNVFSGKAYPIKNGVFSIGAGDTGSVRGACMDERSVIMLGDDRYGATSDYLALERRER